MTPVTTSETIPATIVERSFVCFMLPPFSRFRSAEANERGVMLFMASVSMPRAQASGFARGASARFTRAAPYQCPNGTWFELATKQGACHSSEEAERVCHKLRLYLQLTVRQRLCVHSVCKAKMILRSTGAESNCRRGE